MDTPCPGVREVVSNDEGHHCGPTFANWHENEDSPQGWRPKTYYSLARGEIRAFVDGPCWFGRKFAEACQDSLAPLRRMFRGHALF